jgi:hypothetical protein
MTFRVTSAADAQMRVPMSMGAGVPIKSTRTPGSRAAEWNHAAKDEGLDAHDAAAHAPCKPFDRATPIYVSHVYQSASDGGTSDASLAAYDAEQMFVR